MLKPVMMATMTIRMPVLTAVSLRVAVTALFKQMLKSVMAVSSVLSAVYTDHRIVCRILDAIQWERFRRLLSLSKR